MPKRKYFVCNWETCYAAVWREWGKYLQPIKNIDTLSFEQLVGIASQKERIVKNTELFLSNQQALNVLLWGARGMGKSSLIRAILCYFASQKLRVVEVGSESLYILPNLMDSLQAQDYYFIIFCDDLSFEVADNSYRALKSMLDGSIQSSPRNIIIYATSNRYHIVKEPQSENQHFFMNNDDIHTQNSIDERLSLSDRFGLSIGFYAPSIKEYQEQVESYFTYKITEDILTKALVFASSRGGKSGRVAKQFYIAYCHGLL